MRGSIVLPGLMFWTLLSAIYCLYIEAKAQTSPNYRVVISCPQPSKTAKEEIKCRYDTVYVQGKQDMKTDVKKPRVSVFQEEGRFYRVMVSCPAKGKKTNEQLKCRLDTFEISKTQYYILTKGFSLPDNAKVECSNTPKSGDRQSKCYIILADGTRKPLYEYLKGQLGK